MDNETQGSRVGLQFSKNYVVPFCFLIIWESRWVLRVIAEGKYPVLQASNQKVKKGMERPSLSTVTVQGWPQKHGMEPQFKIIWLIFSSSSFWPFQKPEGLAWDALVTLQHVLHCTRSSRVLQPHTTTSSLNTSPPSNLVPAMSITHCSSQEQCWPLGSTKPGSSSPAGLTQERWWQALHKLMGGHKGTVGTSERSKSKEVLRPVPGTSVPLTRLSSIKLHEGQKLLRFCKNKAPKKQWSL